MTNKKLRMAIDLLWVKHNKVGGVESYIRNILDGLLELEEDFFIYLIVSLDNVESFRGYSKDKRIKLIKCGVYSEKVGQRIFWQNLKLGRVIKSLDVDICFEPHNYIPTFGVKNVKFITTIHDFQLAHHPENFSKKKVLWIRYNWKNTLKKSKIIVAISNSVKDDLNNLYPGYEEKTKVIYNPIIVRDDNLPDKTELFNKYGIDEKEYYYTVASLLPHKNLGTLIKVFDRINKDKIDIPCKLIISGVGGKLKEGFEEELKEKCLDGSVILSGFVSDEERNALYKYSRAFLFPSVFEGFGMPPIEAMYFGVPVITTKETCLEEVTQGKAIYVEDPYSVEEWIDKMRTHYADKVEKTVFLEYNRNVIAKKYYEAFCDL